MASRTDLLMASSGTRFARRTAPRLRLTGPACGAGLVGAAAAAGLLHAGLSGAIGSGGPVWLLAAALAAVTGAVALGWSSLLPGHRQDLPCVLGVLWAVVAVASTGWWPVPALAAALSGLAGVSRPGRE